MVKRFRFFPIPFKNREVFGEGRGPLPEQQGGFGGGAAPPTAPDTKFIIFPFQNPSGERANEGKIVLEQNIVSFYVNNC